MTSLNAKTDCSICTDCSSYPNSSPYHGQDAEEISSKKSQKESPNKLSKEALVSWLFLTGSLMFVVDGVLENLHGISFSSVLHLTASVLFTIGSVLFIPSDS